MRTVQELQDAVDARDLDAVVALLAEDVVFRSPAVHRPYRGRAAVQTLIGAVFEVLEDVRYTRRIGSASDADQALVLEGRVGGRAVEACDFVHVDEDGRIDELCVMVRPLSGLVALAEAMRRRVAEEPEMGLEPTTHALQERRSTS